MKITIDFDQQDITNTSSEAFCGLLTVLKEISSSSRTESENNTEGKNAEKSLAARPKQSSATKVSESKKNAAKTASVKVAEEKTADKPEEVEVKEAEPKNEEAPAKEAEPEKEDAKKESKVDRTAISERLKEIAKNGKAEGKPKKIKALLQEYGVEKVPDLPDDKLEEFLAKVEAL